MAGSRIAILLACGLCAGLVAGCGDNLAAAPEDAVNTDDDSSRLRNRARETSLFGPDSDLLAAIAGDTEEESGGSLPVNRYIWQASLETLDFLPMSSTDPFTGVIVTDWGATPDAPNERFKVTAYLRGPQLAASSLKVAVFRETRSGEGVWIPAVVSPETPRQIEDAILTRARQIRITDLNEPSAG